PPDEKERNSFEKDFDAEELRTITLTRPYYLGKYPVTQKQYKQLTGSNHSCFQVGKRGEEKVRGMDTSDFPMDTVFCEQAIDCCKQMWRHTEQLPAVLRKPYYDKYYRFYLPTEAQWEYACRAGTSTPFHFGAMLNGKQANCDGRLPYGTDQ